MIYLASPYSHPDPAIREVRYDAAVEACALIAGFGLHVFSPIVHWHEAAKRYKLPTDAEFWRGYNKSMQSMCRTTGILRLTGWQESKGMQFEVNKADELGQNLYDVNPLTGLTTLIPGGALAIASQFTVRGNAAHGQNLPQRDAGRGEAPDPLAR